MPGRLENKRAIVTGGGLGLGEGIVRKFVAEGAKVLIFELNRENGEKVASSLQGNAVNFTGDVTKEEDWKGALEKCKESFGGLEVVVNNAGVVHRSAVSSTLPLLRPTGFDVELCAAWSCVKTFKDTEILLTVHSINPALHGSPLQRVRAHNAHQRLSPLPQRQSDPASFRGPTLRRLRQHLVHLRRAAQAQPRLVRWLQGCRHVRDEGIGGGVCEGWR